MDYLKNKELAFKPFLEFPSGTALEILKDSYSELLKEDLGDYNLMNDFKNLEENVYVKKEHLDYGFISTIGGEIVGLGTWGPVKDGIGKVGQNCVVSNYKGKGYGKIQLLEIIRRIYNLGAKEIHVTTNSLSFFEPARRMYESCGFIKIGEKKNGKEKDIEYILRIN